MTDEALEREVEEEVVRQDRKHGRDFDATTVVGQSLLATTVVEQEIREAFEELGAVIGFSVLHSAYLWGTLVRVWREDRADPTHEALLNELLQVEAVARRARRSLRELVGRTA